MSERYVWRPIDTAPKDGTRILLSEGALVHGGVWSTWGGDRKARWAFEVCESSGYDDVPDFEPTYWMPFPAPPKAERAP